MAMITILDIVCVNLAKEAFAGFKARGECQVCGDSIGAHESCPTRSGCRSCVPCADDCYEDYMRADGKTWHGRLPGPMCGFETVKDYFGWKEQLICDLKTEIAQLRTERDEARASEGTA